MWFPLSRHTQAGHCFVAEQGFKCGIPIWGHILVSTPPCPSNLGLASALYLQNRLATARPSASYNQCTNRKGGEKKHWTNWGTAGGEKNGKDTGNFLHDHHKRFAPPKQENWVISLWNSLCFEVSTCNALLFSLLKLLACWLCLG